ncbi:hypothetical protein HCX49_02255 [Sphingobacterium kitahiroshimense]|nr:hypothetical protein [Sphingobacterium sp. B16(2022)]
MMLSIFVFAQDQNSTVITAKSPDQLYLGALLQESLINTKTHDVLPIIQDDIVVSFGRIKLKSKIIKSEKAAFYNVIEEAQQIANSVPHSENSFSFSIKDLKSYGDVAHYFGQKIDVADWFSVSDPDEKPQTLLAVNMERVAFTAEMDLPAEGKFKTNNALLDRYNSNELIYVNTLSFGRRAIVLVESNLDSSQVKNALSAILTRKELSNQEKGVLANCTFRVALLGSQDVIDVDSSRMLEEVLDYIDAKKDFSSPGLPISFGAAYLRNNQIFSNTY